MISKIAATALIALILSTGIAHADTNLNDLICTEMRMGMSPDQITSSITSGDPTMPGFVARGKVINQLGACDQSTP